jgi:single-stranded DNA-binding protein
MTGKEKMQEQQLVCKIGNLTRDPELRYTHKNGQALCEVDLAVNPLANETDKETEFYHLLIFGAIGENVSESKAMIKSTRVIVVGTPDVEELKDEETGQVNVRKKIFVTAIGPDLRYAMCPEIQKVHRTSAKPTVDISSF